MSRQIQEIIKDDNAFWVRSARPPAAVEGSVLEEVTVQEMWHVNTGGRLKTEKPQRPIDGDFLAQSELQMKR